VTINNYKDYNNVGYPFLAVRYNTNTFAFTNI
jgi:hypothetical protein